MNTVRTLVVDDALFIRQMLKQIFSRTEFQVVGEAGSAEEAVVKYDTLAPEMVIMDIMMPGTSGIDAVKLILGKDPAARIVMCSALGQETTVEEALAAGARDFIIKPFMPDQVLQTLRALTS